MNQQDAFIGSLVADAVAMPVHWYYNPQQLKKDYGVITGFQAPKNPHPDAKGQVHYHQFLKAGENTLNFRLARLLADQVKETGRYDAEVWLVKYVNFLQSTGLHNDSYMEGSHRSFLENYQKGKNLLACGTANPDIGGLVPVPALFWALGPTNPELRPTVQKHVALTHKDEKLLKAADDLVQLLSALAQGQNLRAAILKHGSAWVTEAQLNEWNEKPDTEVIGLEKTLSPACPIAGSFPASLFLAWKYSADFSKAICANAQVGGDNCHRGAVVGSLLGISQGISNEWLIGLAT